MRNCLRRILLVYCLHGCCLHTPIWAQERSGCAVVGIVFDIDLQRRSLMLKDKTGFIGKSMFRRRLRSQNLASETRLPGPDESRSRIFTRTIWCASKAIQETSRSPGSAWLPVRTRRGLSARLPSNGNPALFLDRSCSSIGKPARWWSDPQIPQNPPAPTQINLPPDVQYRSYPIDSTADQRRNVYRLRRSATGRHGLRARKRR